MQWCIISIGLAFARAGDETSLMQRQVQGLSDESRIVSVLDKVGHAESACVPVLAGERAPIIGSFSSRNGQIQNAHVRVGQVAPMSGSFCVETASLALLQRSSGLSKIVDFEQALSDKATKTQETSNSSGIEKAVQAKLGSGASAKAAFKCPSLGGQSLLQGPFSIIPGFEQATQAAQTAINAATKATTIIGKLAELAKATAAATVASTAGALAVQTLGTNMASITQTINQLGLQTLFDGQWSPQDLIVLTKFDDYVKITDQILASTSELETVACSFHAIVAVQTSIIDILNSVKELAPVLGDLKIAEFENFSKQSTRVAEQCVDKASEISSADKDLRPGLDAYTSGTPAQQAKVLLTHGVAFERGFTKLGKAWQEVKKFQDEKIKPLMDGINPLVSKLNANVIGFNPLR